MKLGQDLFPQSSFLSVDKNLALIVNKFLENQRLCKLLFYTQKDCLKADNLSMQQRIGLLHEQIKIVPYLPIEGRCPNYITITFNKFLPNATNPQFRDFNIKIDIVCHPDHWNLGDFALRPYKIAGEIDSMLNGKKLTGIGKVEFSGADDLLLNEQLCGLTLIYRTVQGIEDKIDPLTS